MHGPINFRGFIYTLVHAAATAGREKVSRVASYEYDLFVDVASVIELGTRGKMSVAAQQPTAGPAWICPEREGCTMCVCVRILKPPKLGR